MNSIQRLWQQIQELFVSHLPQEREIKDVESWDGSASRWSDTSAYCDDCLINVNADAGNTQEEEWDLDHCKLPVREPGDPQGTYVRQAVYAAAGGRGLSAVERPGDVAADDWAEAVESAAREIIAAYREMDEYAPTAIYEAAGQDVPEEARAISMWNLFSQAEYQTWAGTDMWLHDIYVEDDGTMYAIASAEGKLYRANVSLVEGEAVVGEWERVEVQHVPSMRSITIRQQADGLYRWAGIACTAILNKDGEVDGTSLFDRFVEHFEQRDLDKPVYLDFSHEDIFLGEVDYVARDGYVFLASGLLRDDEVGRAVAEGLRREPDYWGQSIAYMPMASPTFIEVGDDVQFPVWEDGRLERIALLPVGRASAWFTNIQTRSSDTMNDKIKEQLAKLVGEDIANQLAEGVDGVNRSVTEGGLIARETGEGNSPQDNTSQEEDEQERSEDKQPRAPQTEAEVIRKMRTQLDEQTKRVTALLKLFNDLVIETDQRLAALERSEEERMRAYLGDLPQRQAQPLQRPRLTRKEASGEEEQPRTYAEIAADYLREIGLE